MGMVREQDLFIALGPALDFLVTFARDRQRSARDDDRARERRGSDLRGMLCAATDRLSRVARTILAFVDRRTENDLDLSKRLARTTFAGERTVLLDATGVAGVRRPRIAGDSVIVFIAIARESLVICLVMVLTQIYVGGSLDTWAGAGSFGQRRLIGLTVFLVIGLAGLFAHVPGRRGPRRVFYGFVALSIWWNLGVTAQFGTGLMDRQHMDIGRVAYHNFVTIPQLIPSLAYRYAFERESFYQRPNPSTP